MASYRVLAGAGWVQVPDQPRYVFEAVYGHRVVSAARRHIKGGVNRWVPSLVCSCGWSLAAAVMMESVSRAIYLYQMHLGLMRALEIWLTEDEVLAAGWVSRVCTQIEGPRKNQKQ